MTIVMCLKKLCPMVAAPRTDDVSDVNIAPLLKSLVEREERELLLINVRE